MVFVNHPRGVFDTVMRIKCGDPVQCQNKKRELPLIVGQVSYRLVVPWFDAVGYGVPFFCGEGEPFAGGVWFIPAEPVGEGDTTEVFFGEAYLFHRCYFPF